MAFHSPINHPDTVHASALLTLPEAGSGAFLLAQVGDSEGMVPVVRRFECKFRKPSHGWIFGRAIVPKEEVRKWRRELADKVRERASLPMEVIDE